MFETLLYAIDRHGALTLNRPEKMNACNGVGVAELIAAFDEADADVRAIIVTGTGRAFCARADLSSVESTFEREDASATNGARSTPRDIGGVIAILVLACAKPVIPAINGPAVGFGATFTWPMDFRLKAEGRGFGFVSRRRGICPKAASTWYLPHVAGVGPALEWTLTGRMVGAQEAHAVGLLRSVHAPEDLLPAATAVAHEIADFASPMSVALSWAMMWRGLGLSHPLQAHRIESDAIVARGQSADAKDGVSAFLEKRSPDWPERVSRDMPHFYPRWTDPGYGEAAAAHLRPAPQISNQ